jgi:hypothetical protein
MSNWDSARVCDACEQVPVGTKYSKELVQDHGMIKVLDQSQADIFGWHNNSADIYASPESPVFTFANHTCSMRWMDEPFSVIQNVFPMRGIPGKTDTRFLYYASGASVVQDGYKGHFPQFRESIIQIPPLSEQKKIAEILSGIDTQRQALAKKVANASMLRNALGEKIFSSLDGERVALGELCNPKQWQTISTNQLTTSGYPVYGANGKIGYFTEYNHKEPVLAVTCRGATCGNLTLIPAFSYVTGNSMCLDNPRKDTSPLRSQEGQQSLIRSRH